ncbi:WD40-repeat-containing domain protein [Limtongia smithiae]|uniref:WD40-repeat-containing domain protein n=1 Tax=Limtongia smithiae TaxID=1125753 RepID=UPI0034CFC296
MPPKPPSTPAAGGGAQSNLHATPASAASAAASSTPVAGSAAAVATPASTPAPQYSQADLNQIVLEYLRKRGYSRTEAMLRIESRGVGGSQAPPAPAAAAPSIPLKSTTDDPQLYIRAYMSLRDWIETSLDLFRPELRKLLFPIFVHTFFYLIQKTDPKAQGVTLARKFFDMYSRDHTLEHGYDLLQLSGITLADHLAENPTANLFRTAKYRLNMSRTTFDLLLHFLDENERSGGAVTIRILNQYIDTNVTPSRPDRFSGTAALSPEEGLPGHISSEGRFNAQSQVKLCPRFPMDESMARDVELRLKDEQHASEDGPLLVQDFQELRQMESSEDAPPRDSLPLPPYRSVDVETEIRAVKDARKRIKIGPVRADDAATLPSVCMYTYHNTYDNMNCLEFADDLPLAAGGFADSYIKVWSLKGEKLQSQVKGSFPQTSQRLVGHAGPVYGLSFSNDARFLLSCSEDKTARLWSMDTYTGLVSYKGHSQPVWDVAFSPVGHYFATASHDQTARLWSCDHIYPLRIFAGHLSDVDCVTFHPNSTYVLTGSSDKSCRMWDVARGSTVRVMISHNAPVSALEVSPDGRTLASAADDGTILLWDLGSGRTIKAMRGHVGGVNSLSFSREGSVLVSAGMDCSVRVWDVKGGSTTPVDGVTGVDIADKAGDVDVKNGAATPAAASTVTVAPKTATTTADHMAAYMTKKTPVYNIKFTRRNVCMAGGAFLGTA